MADWDSARIRAIWDGLAEAWDANRALVWSWTRPVSEDLIRKLDPRPGETILEVGAGPGDTGFVVAPMLEPGGRLVATDLSTEMLGRARAAAEGLGLRNVEFRQMDVMALDLPGSSVDGVIGRFVYHLVPDPQAAFAEARRVLRPGGTLAYTVFGPADAMPFDSALEATMKKLGLGLDQGIQIDVELNTETSVTAVTRAGGFDQVDVDGVPFALTFADADAMWRYVTEMYGRQAALIRGLEPAQQEEYRETLFAEVDRFRSGEGYEFPALCLNVRAR
jgi:ubiquinone/menaquinone biosynthesis C-methylase UbiE